MSLITEESQNLKLIRGFTVPPQNIQNESDRDQNILPMLEEINDYSQDKVTGICDGARF